MPGDHRLHLRRAKVPIQPRRFDPAPGLVLHQHPLALKAAQQLDGEQRIAVRVVVQRLAEVCPQAVRLAVDVGLDERPPIRLVQVDQDVAPLAGKLVEDAPILVQPTAGAALPRRRGLPARAQRLRAVGADEQDAAAGQAAPQVKEQRRRAAVGPLQVVDHQQQGSRMERVCSTWVTWANRSGCAVGAPSLARATISRSRVCQRAGPAGAGKALQALQQRLARHKAVDQVRAVLHQRRAHRRQRLPDPRACSGESVPPARLLSTSPARVCSISRNGR